MTWVPARLARPTAIRASRHRAAISSRRVPAQIARASKNDEPDLDPEEPGFFGSDDWDGNEGPFIRPEGSPFFASYTDPPVWKLMQENHVAGEVEQILPAKA